jgi:hypothetical protein
MTVWIIVTLGYRSKGYPGVGFACPWGGCDSFKGKNVLIPRSDTWFRTKEMYYALFARSMMYGGCDLCHGHVPCTLGTCHVTGRSPAKSSQVC